jgi:hypothetical protein
MCRAAAVLEAPGSSRASSDTRCNTVGVVLSPWSQPIGRWWDKFLAAEADKEGWPVINPLGDTAQVDQMHIQGVDFPALKLAKATTCLGGKNFVCN